MFAGSSIVLILPQIKLWMIDTLLYSYEIHLAPLSVEYDPTKWRLTIRLFTDSEVLCFDTFRYWGRVTHIWVDKVTQIIACRPLAAEPLSAPMLVYCQLKLYSDISNYVILPWPDCVKWLHFLIQTRTTRTPVFWEYIPLPHDYRYRFISDH